MTAEDCTTIDRTQLTWDWNNQTTIVVGDYSLVKPAWGHNNIQVIGTPSSITIFSNGGTQDRTGHEYLNGDWGSGIQWVELCGPVSVPPVTEPELPVMPELPAAPQVIPTMPPPVQVEAVTLQPTPPALVDTAAGVDALSPAMFGAVIIAAAMVATVRRRAR